MNMGAIYGFIAMVAIAWSVRRWSTKNQIQGRKRGFLGFVGAVLLGFVIAMPFQAGAEILFLSLGVGRAPVSGDRRQVVENTLTVTLEPDSSFCLWLAKAELLRAKRISGSSQFVEWFDKHGETGLDYSAASEEMVNIIKEYQPYQKQFVDDWVKLGAHAEGKDFWEKELSSVELRIQAFDLIVEGFESSDQNKYNRGLITWEKSAQVGNESSSAMFEIATECTTSQIEPSRTPTIRPTTAPTLPPQPSPTPTSNFPTPSFLVFGKTTWVYYEDQDANFSAYFPESWQRKAIPSEPDNPGRGVAFVAPLGSAGMEGNTVILVASLPTLDFLGSTYPTVEELDRLLQELSEYAKVDVVTPPTATKIHGYPAVQSVSETSLSDENYRVRMYSVAIATNKWIHIIQVTGLTYYDDQLQAMYTEFVENFSPNVP
ncbi:MAG: hypothetical protein WAV74_12740 [Anaerolineae bacterium]|uniref:hypothetical protein n=1 Tax=Chloroflexota TaxID=200795 RepID=UPI001DCB084E|nr:hypothetical protein [Anaerolineae bacterium]MBK9613350.1 hypothetical protein [Dehalococcoidia bacterium]